MEGKVNEFNEGLLFPSRRQRQEQARGGRLWQNEPRNTNDFNGGVLTTAKPAKSDQPGGGAWRENGKAAKLQNKAIQ
jgi:hypothetical protein